MTLISSETASTYNKIKITRLQAFYFLILAAAWILAYFSTFERLVHTWFESTTFEHAVLIVPIALWLIYRKRFAFGLARRNKLDFFFGLLGLLSLIAIFLIGKLALINALQQFALMSMPLFFILGVFGLATLRHLLFPLLFLILAVPFGEFMIPYLQEVTADLTVIMLKLVGVPVYREGWYLEIPEGLFHVAEACSGIRFLFSTITIGLLIAHLEIRSRVKQTLFMLCVLVIPILANGMRAFIMVYIGHVSNMKAAVGFDHLVYGWLFFFFVTALVLLFSRLFYDEKSLPRLNDEYVELSAPNIRIFASVLIIALGPVFMLAFNSQKSFALNSQTVEKQNSQAISMYAGWQPVYSAYDKYRTKLLSINNETVILHEITYLTEGDEKELLTWSNRAYDPEIWSVAESEVFEYKNEKGRIHYNYLMLKNGMGRSINLIYLWKIGDKYTANPIKVKSLQVLNKLMLNDFGGVALYAATEGSVPKDSLIDALLKLEEQKK